MSERAGEASGLSWTVLATVLCLLASEVCPFVDDRMSERYGPDWLSTHGPPSLDHPNITDPAVALRTIVTRGMDFLDFGDDGRRIADRLVQARNRLFHFALLSLNEARAILMDVAALLKTLGSDWAGKVESVVQDPAGDAFETILNFVLSQQVPVDVNRLMFVTPHDLMRVYRASPREGALIEEWRRFRTAAGQLDISSFPDHSATTEARELSFNDKAFLSSRRNVKPILRDVDGFQIFDEGVTPWVPVFLDEWVSTLLPEIERYLGQRWPERIPIILSLHSADSARFPPDAGLDRDLLSPESTEEDESEAPETDPDALERRWWSYAYGIATRVSEQHNPPTGVGLGSPAVYLNVEHIERLAAQLQVQPEALIAAKWLMSSRT